MFSQVLVEPHTAVCKAGLLLELPISALGAQKSEPASNVLCFDSTRGLLFQRLDSKEML